MSNTKNNLPAMPFYVGDWLKCPEVRALPPDYRGLWFDMICFMWESVERGVMIKPNGKPYADSDIVRMVGLDNQNSGIWLTHLLDNGVCSRRDDGAIYSKRMVKDEKLRGLRSEIGKRGGNPHLLVNHTLKREVNQNVENEYAIENEKNTTKTTKPKQRFVAPTLEEVQVYFKERKTRIDPVAFHAYYEVRGWKGVVKWKMCLTTWEQRDKASVTSSGSVAVSVGKRPPELIVLEMRVLKWDDGRLKNHLLEQGYTEKECDMALGKKY